MYIKLECLQLLHYKNDNSYSKTDLTLNIQQTKNYKTTQMI